MTEPVRTWIATFEDLPPGAALAVSAPNISNAVYQIRDAAFIEMQERARRAAAEAEAREAAEAAAAEAELQAAEAERTLFHLSDRSNESFPS